jgi:hypothetical protein
MKRLPLLAVFLLLGCGGVRNPITVNTQQHKKLEDHSISMTWQQSFVNNNACSSTVTTSCISGFSEGYMVGTSQTQLHTDTAAVCSGTTQPENCASTFNGLIPIGNVVFYVATTFIDQNGAAGVTSAALSPPVPVSADKAVNVNATVGP